MAFSDIIVHYWKLDSSAEDTGGKDFGTQCDLAVTNATYVSGALLDCLRFDGTDDKAETEATTDMPSGTGDYSISLWTKPNESGTGAIYSTTDEGGGERIVNIASGNVRIFFGGADTGNLNYFNDQTGNTWYHVCIVRQTSGSLLTYISGALVDVQTDATGSITLGNARFGSDFENGDDYEGDTDEIGFFSGALTPDEVTTLFNSGSPLPYASIVQTNATISPSTLTMTMSEQVINITIEAQPVTMATTLTNLTPGVKGFSYQKIGGPHTAAITNDDKWTRDPDLDKIIDYSKYDYSKIKDKRSY